MKFRRCPTSTVPPETWTFIQAFSFYKNGITPNGKGWMQESNKYVQAMCFIDGKINERQREIDKNGK